MRPALALAALLASLSLVSCSGGGDDDDTYLLELDGRAEIDGTEQLAAGDHQLEVGQVVRIIDGSARFGLSGDRFLELRAGDRPVDDSRLEVADVPTLVDGHALLVAGEGERLRLQAGTATVELEAGAARLRRSTGVSLAVYEGSAGVEALGQELEEPVAALRQVAVPDTGALPRRVSPLVYDRSDLDPWDRRYLGGAVRLGSQLDRSSLALNRQLDAPDGGPDATYLESVLPALGDTPDFDGSLLAGWRASVGETVVGASIVLGGEGPFAERWRSAFDFREQGADWGLVALDQEAQREAVVGTIDAVLDAVAATLPSFSPMSSGSGGQSTVAGPGLGESPPAPPSGPTDGGGDDGDGEDAPGEPPPESPTEPTLPPLLPPLLEEPDSGSQSEPSPTTPESDRLTVTTDGLLGPLTDPLLG